MTYEICKRLFDFFFSLLFLLILLPFFILISLAIILTSGFPVFYSQQRVGKNFRTFSMLKFRTMKTGSDQSGLLTVGNDSRITSVGKFLRRWKLDELPQLVNVVIGHMSFVGPRPEVPKYVSLYNEQQKKTLLVRPGLTDPASLHFFNENKILGSYENPEEAYIKEIMLRKLEMYADYIRKRNFLMDMKIILATIGRIFSS